MRITFSRGTEVGSILDVKSTGLGSAVKELKRHSKIGHRDKPKSSKGNKIHKAPKIKHTKKKVTKKVVVKKPIKHVKMNVTVHKTPKVIQKPKEHGYKSHKNGNIYYD